MDSQIILVSHNIYDSDATVRIKAMRERRRRRPRFHSDPFPRTERPPVSVYVLRPYVPTPPHIPMERTPLYVQSEEERERILEGRRFALAGSGFPVMIPIYVIPKIYLTPPDSEELMELQHIPSRPSPRRGRSPFDYSVSAPNSPRAASPVTQRHFSRSSTAATSQPRSRYDSVYPQPTKGRSFARGAVSSRGQPPLSYRHGTPLQRGVSAPPSRGLPTVGTRRGQSVQRGAVSSTSRGLPPVSNRYGTPVQRFPTIARGIAQLRDFRIFY